MKIKSIIAATLMTAAFITATSTGAFAQAKACCPSAGQGTQVQQDKCCPGSDLTAEQKTQIETLKTAFMKEKMLLNNQIAEKKAHLKTLSMMDEPNMTEINKTIDEAYVIKADLAKRKAAHIQAIRKVLTPEQRMKFDMKHGDMDDEGHGKAGMGCQQGGGQGAGCQQGGGQGAGCQQGGGQGMGCQQGGGQGMGCQQGGGQGMGCKQGAGQGQSCPTQKAGCQTQDANKGAGCQDKGAGTGAGQGAGCHQQGTK